jgi:5'-nucleotidase
VPKSKPQILVVNDDGVHGGGLRPLAKALASVGNVTVVVPERERSAASHAITLHKPIRVRRLEKIC